MPRVNSLTASARVENQLLAVIDKHMRLAGKQSYKELAPIIGKCDRTMLNRQKRPGDFTLEEMLKLMRSLNIPPSEFAEVFSGAM